MVGIRSHLLDYIVGKKMNYRLLNVNDLPEIKKIADHYYNFYIKKPKPYYDLENYIKELEFLKNGLFENEGIVCSGEFDGSNLISIGVGMSFNYKLPKESELYNKWLWRILYTKNIRMRISAHFIDKIAHPILETFESKNYRTFYKVTKIPKLAVTDANFLKTHYNKIINFETYSVTIKYICKDPIDVQNIEWPYCRLFLKNWKPGIFYALMEHTKKE